jgi:phospholipid/cholesterol/gamma-HCH transport system substrate-binding protein
MRLRHTDHWIGALVILSVLLFLGVVLQAGILRDWFRTSSTLRIMLPEAGVSGLSDGADVEVLGIRAGQVRRIVIDPSQQMYAEADIEDQAQSFIRRNSQAVIRRRFGIAGPAFVDISRGTGTGLDWHYAVIQAVTERAPTESVGTLVDEMREKIFPILDDAGRAMKALAATMERIDKGEGNVGRLLTDETLVLDAEGAVAEGRAAAGNLNRILAELDTVSHDVAGLVRAVNARDGGVPSVIHRLDEVMASLQQAVLDLARAAQHAPQIARNVESSTTNLPSLLTQTELTAQQLSQLLVQLRELWLLGGSGKPVTPTPTRLPATEVRP